MDHHLRALILHSFKKSTVLSSSSIQTVLSAPESHRIMPLGSRALPPVGNLTLPGRYLFVYFNTLSVICKAKFLFYSFHAEYQLLAGNRRITILRLWLTNRHAGKDRWPAHRACALEDEFFYLQFTIAFWAAAKSFSST